MKILIEFKNLLMETLKDNKRLIIGLYLTFIIFFVAAWILSGARVESAISNMPISNATSTPNMSADSAVELFINNEWGGIVTYVFSIFFAILAIIMLVYNAVNLGVLGQLFNQVIPNGGIKYIVYLIPHGIFEITATVLQSVAGVLLFIFIWRFIKAWRSNNTSGASEAFEKTKKILVQSIILMIFSTILLLVAAPIEAYFSVPFSEFIIGP
ncbi:stage II sporulation protein M [Methanobrevibacter sp.]|uniref:stage II sporulation protein M n=1 Tax=Methanobrevibacter sp. TaxID=66852 RepID=UPI00389026B8